MDKDLLEAIKETRKYISSRWPLALHKPENEPRTPYSLPYPFVPPCIAGDFHVLFYWDTFYTNRGMIADSYFDYAKWNVDNLLYVLNKIGFVPNAYSENLVKWCSQPPYLHFMIQDIYEVSKDENWLKEAYFVLKKEYEFWMKERITPNGLNRHFHNLLSNEDLYEYYQYVAKERLSLRTDLPKEEQTKKGESYIAAAECGLDFSPRFRDNGININPVDLNANLYGLETFLASLADKFEKNKKDYFSLQAKMRKEKMDKLMLGSDGLYYDYDFQKKEIYRKNYCFTGQFMPFIVGLSNNKEAAKKILERLSYSFGIVSTQNDPNEKIPYQAAYPYSWPYDNYLAYWGLKSLGLEEEMRKVGEDWLKNVALTFKNTGKLWETYEPFKGGRATKKEYPANEMMGWTAGTFSSICEDFGIKN